MKRLRRTGVVRDPNGQPVGGALVRACADERFDEPVAETTTGPDGQFAFELPARSYVLRAHHDTLCAEQYVVSTDIEAAELRLRRGARITVQVNHENGTPVVGAKVQIGHISTVTDTRGAAYAAGLFARSHDVTITAPGLGAIRATCAADATRTFTLLRAARMQGVVRGPLGRLVPQARIMALRANGSGLVFAATGEDGSWTIELPTGVFQLRASYPGFEGSSIITIHSDGETSQAGFIIELGFSSAKTALGSVARRAIRNLRDPSRYRISGTVVDTTGAGCIARVYANPTGLPGRWRLVRTDEQGRFEIDDLEPVVHAVSAGWNDPREDADATPFVHVRPGASLTLTLRPSATITGRVLFEGAPLTYFGLGLWKPDSIGPGIIAIESTDGRFSLPKVGRGSWQLAIMGLETTMHMHPLTVDNGQHIDIGDVELARGRTLTGRVRDPNGEPVVGARVSLGYRLPQDHKSSPLEDATLHGHYETTTENDGTYRFGGVHQDKRFSRSPQVWATHRGMASLIRELGENATLDFILLESGRIAGTVKMKNAAHVPLIHAVRGDEAKDARYAAADFHEHTFQFDDVPLGSYIVSLGDEVDAEPVTVTVRPGETARAVLTVTNSDIQVEVTLPRGAERDFKMEPVSPGAEIRGRVRSAGMTINGQPQDHMTYTLYHVRPGTYRISVDGSTWTEVVVAAEPAVQTFDLRK